MLAAVYRSVLFHDDSKLFVFTYIALAVVLAIWLGLFWLAMVVVAHLLIEIVKQHHYDPRPLPVLARSLWDLKLDIGLVVCGLVIGLYIDVVFGLVGLSAAGRAGAQAAARVGLWQRGLRGALLTLDDVAIVAKARGAGANGEAALEQELATTGARASASGGAQLTEAAGSDPGDAGFRSTSGGSDDHSTVSPAGSEAAGAEDRPGPADIGDTHAHVEPPHRPPVPPSRGPALWGGWAAARWSRGDWLSLAFTAANILLIVAAPVITGDPAGSVWSAVLADLHPFPNH